MSEYGMGKWPRFASGVYDWQTMWHQVHFSRLPLLYQQAEQPILSIRGCREGQMWSCGTLPLLILTHPQNHQLLVQRGLKKSVPLRMEALHSAHEYSRSKLYWENMWGTSQGNMTTEQISWLPYCYITEFSVPTPVPNWSRFIQSYRAFHIP